jgi:hypothetical protein
MLGLGYWVGLGQWVGGLLDWADAIRLLGRVCRVKGRVESVMPMSGRVGSGLSVSFPHGLAREVKSGLKSRGQMSDASGRVSHAGSGGVPVAIACRVGCQRSGRSRDLVGELSQAALRMR